MTPSLPRGQSAPKVRAPGVILRDLQNHGAPGETRTWHTLAHASGRYSPSPPCSRLGPPCGDDTPSPTERAADSRETGCQQTPSPVLLRLPSKRGVGGGDRGSPRREWRAGVRPLGGRGVCPACSGKSDRVRAAGPAHGPGLAAEPGVWGGQQSGPHVAVLRTDRRGGQGQECGGPCSNPGETVVTRTRR